MNQHEFYQTPEVKASIEIQKQNPYGSNKHKEAYEMILNAAIKYGVEAEYRKSGGGDY